MDSWLFCVIHNIYRYYKLHLFYKIKDDVLRRISCASPSDTFTSSIICIYQSALKLHNLNESHLFPPEMLTDTAI